MTNEAIIRIWWRYLSYYQTYKQKLNQSKFLIVNNIYRTLVKPAMIMLIGAALLFGFPPTIIEIQPVANNESFGIIDTDR